MNHKWITYRLGVVGMMVAIALVGMLCVDRARADTVTDWYYTGSLNDARWRGTATLLQNGKVLVAGGYGFSGILNSAELYDPATGIWSRTGNLNTSREFHSATLLPDGRVLVAGGDHSGEPAFNSAEVYDPYAGTWSYTGNMNFGRVAHVAVLLSDGRVLVAGGSNMGNYEASAELYNPVTGEWSITGSMNISRNLQSVTLLPNGKVLVAGGYHQGYGTTSAEIYDPDTGTWSTTGDMNEARSWHTATLLPNGKVLVAGSEIYGNTLASAELYDPAKGTWSYTGRMNDSRGSHIAMLLPGGKVLVAGGRGDNPASAELYDSDTGAWSSVGSMNDGRIYFMAAFLPNGKVLVTGGELLATTEIFISDIFSSKTVDKADNHPGTVVNYAITTSNIITDTIENVLITDTLPISLTYQDGSLSATSGMASYQDGVITWTGAITASTTVTVSFGATVSPTTPFGTTITNEALINARGNIYSREATIEFVPYQILMPCMFKPCPPSFSDDFSNPASGWPTESGPDYSMGYQNGAYYVTVNQGWIAWAIRDFGVADFKIAVDAWPGATLNGGTAIMFSVTDDGFFVFDIDNGQFSVWRIDASSWTWTPLIDWTYSSAILPGFQVNRMTVERVGSNITVYANGQKLGSVNDGTYRGTWLGMAAEATTGYFDGRFDNFTLYTGKCIGAESATIIPNLTAPLDAFWITPSFGPSGPGPAPTR